MAERPTADMTTEVERRNRAMVTHGSEALLRALHREHAPIVRFLLANQNKARSGLDG
jgi:hypothetical protein